MPGTTPIYQLPFQTLTDPPHGPNLGQALAQGVEAQLIRVTAARYQADGSGNLPLVAAVTDVPGASVAVTAQTTLCFYIAVGTFRFQRTSVASAAFAIGRLTIDGVDAPGQCPIRHTATADEDFTQSRTWTGVLAPGAHTLKLRASCATAGIWSTAATDSALSVLVFG